MDTKELVEILLKRCNSHFLSNVKGKYNDDSGTEMVDLMGIAVLELRQQDSKEKSPGLSRDSFKLSPDQRIFVAAAHLALRVLLESCDLESPGLVKEIKARNPLEECVQKFIQELKKHPINANYVQDALGLLFSVKGVIPCLAQNEWFFGDEALSSILMECNPSDIRLSPVDANDFLEVTLTSDGAVHKVLWLVGVLLKSSHWNASKVREHLGTVDKFFTPYWNRIFWRITRGLGSQKGKARQKAKKELKELATQDVFLELPVDGTPRNFLRFIFIFLKLAPPLPQEAKERIYTALQESRFAALAGFSPLALLQKKLPAQVAPQAATLLDAKTNELLEKVRNQIMKNNALDCDILKILTLASPTKSIILSDAAARSFVSKVMETVVSTLMERLGSSEWSRDLKVSEDDVRRVLGCLLFSQLGSLVDPKDCVLLLAMMTVVRCGDWDKHKKRFNSCTKKLWEMEPRAGRDPSERFRFFFEFRGALSFLLRHEELIYQFHYRDAEVNNIWSFLLLQSPRKNVPIRPQELLNSAEYLSADLQGNMIPIILSTDPVWTPRVARKELSKELPYVWLIYLLLKVQFNFNCNGDSSELYEDLESLGPVIRDQEWEVEPVHLQNLLSFKEPISQQHETLRTTLHSLANWTSFEKANRDSPWFPGYFLQEVHAVRQSIGGQSHTSQLQPSEEKFLFSSLTLTKQSTEVRKQLKMQLQQLKDKLSGESLVGQFRNWKSMLTGTAHLLNHHPKAETPRNLLQGIENNLRPTLDEISELKAKFECCIGAIQKHLSAENFPDSDPLKGLFEDIQRLQQADKGLSLKVLTEAEAQFGKVLRQVQTKLAELDEPLTSERVLDVPCGEPSLEPSSSSSTMQAGISRPLFASSSFVEPVTTNADEKKQQHTCSRRSCNGSVVKNQHSFCTRRQLAVWLCPEHWQKAVDGTMEGARQCPHCWPEPHILTEGRLRERTTFTFKSPEKNPTRWSGAPRRGGHTGAVVRPTGATPSSVEESGHTSSEEQGVPQQQPPRVTLRSQSKLKKNKARGCKPSTEPRLPSEREVEKKFLQATSSIDWSSSPNSKPSAPKKSKPKKQKEKNSIDVEVERALHQALSFRGGNCNPKRKGKSKKAVSMGSRREVRAGPTQPTRLPAREKECVVCLDGLPTIRFLPCHHFASCSKCSAGLEKCPICAVEITGNLAVGDSDHVEFDCNWRS